MPPAKKRTRSYDPAKVRTAVRTQFSNVREAVLALEPEQLESATGLGGWTVRELAAHITMGFGAVSRFLAMPEPPAREVTLLEWPFATASAAAQVDEEVRASAAQELGELYARTLHDFDEAMPDITAGRLTPTRFGAMTLDDFLVTRTVELIVHTGDLNDAVPGLDIPYDRQALAACTRLLADALAVKAPGGAVEVRIPPFAVVQCVQGPRHTRGTPPNVVETDPLTWIRLATGRTDWGTALDAARVSASGERADLAELLPVMS
jgi:uncharacterized protein (TIGR03083 family)